MQNFNKNQSHKNLLQLNQNSHFDKFRKNSEQHSSGFHKNKILELRSKIILQQREEAKHLSFKDYTHKLNKKYKHSKEYFFEQDFYFLQDPNYINHSKILVHTKSGPVVLFNSDLLKKLSPKHIESLLAHELGHWHYSHTQLDFDLQSDFEADEFAITLVGVDQLIETLTFVSKFTKDKKNIEQRIDKLQKIKFEFKLAS